MREATQHSPFPIEKGRPCRGALTEPGHCAIPPADARERFAFIPALGMKIS